MRNRVDEMFGAFADFTRIRILHILIHREAHVGELMGALKAPQSKVSRHLAYLRNAGLVQDRKDGRLRWYSLVKPGTRFHAHILECLRICHTEVELLKKDFGRLKKLKPAVQR
jgi:ArsR family transcriptional regulator